MADAFAAIVPIGRQLFVSAFVFRPGFSSTWAANRLQIERKLATSYAPLVGRPAAHFLRPSTHHPRSSPGQGRGGGIVPCRDSFGFPSIFCCPPEGEGWAVEELRCRPFVAALPLTFFVLRLYFFCRPNFSCCAAQFDLRRFLFIPVSFKARSVL